MAITYSSPNITVGTLELGTATSGSTTTLADTSKSWTTNEHAGRAVVITSGTGAEQLREIESNTGTTLTLKDSWDTAPASGSVYEILYNVKDVYDADVAGGWGAVSRVGSSQYRYDFGSRRMVVSGGIFFSETYPAVWGSWSDNTKALTANSGGIIGIGGVRTRSRVIDFRKSLLLETDQSANSNENWSCVYISTGGWLYWNGGDVQGHFCTTFQEGSHIRIASDRCRLINEGPEVRIIPGTTPQIRQRASDVEVNGWTVFGLLMTIVGNATKLENIKHSYIESGLGVLASSTSPSNTWLKFRNYDGSDNITINFGIYASKWMRLINLWDGTNCVNETYASTGTVNKGLNEIRQEIQFSMTSGSGAKIYTKDTNNGLRLAANQVGTNPSYTSDREYTLIESGGVAEYTTDGGVLIGVYYNKDGGTATVNDKFDSRGINNNTSDIFTWMKVEYGQQPSTSNIVMKGTSAVEAEIQSLPDLGVTESIKSTVGAYTGITPVYSGGTLTVTVSSNHTWNEVYDYIKYYESENPANVWANSKASFVTTSNKLSYTYNNLVVVVDGATLTMGAGQSLPTNPTVQNDGKFLSDAITLFYDGSDLVKASKVYFQVKDSVTASNIEEAVIGFGDATEQERLLYNNSFALDTLVTDASGKADGYFAFQKGATVYSDIKQVVGEYDHIFATIPRTLNGTAIGSSASPEVIRLAPDDEVTLTKANAGLITGITVDVATDTIDLSDETLSNAYDNLKYQLTQDADIDTGIPGCMYFCLYDLPLSKSGTIYTGRSSSTIYQNMDGSGATFGTGVVELDTAGTYSDFTFNEVQINFEGAGTFDLRSSQFNAGVTVDTIGDYTVTALFPVGISVTNNDATNITVTQNEAFTITGANVEDGSYVWVYNVTQDTTIEKATVSGGGGYSYSGTLGTGEEFEVGDEIQIVVNHYDYLTLKVSRTASSGGLTFTDTQIADNRIDKYGISQATASAYTKFSADYPNIHIEFVGTGNFEWGGDELYAWWKNEISTDPDAIENLTGLFTTGEFGKLVIDTDVVDLQFENPNAATTNAIQTNNNTNLNGLIAFERSDGGVLFATGGIAVKVGEVVVATISTSSAVISGTPADVRAEMDANSTKLEKASKYAKKSYLNTA